MNDNKKTLIISIVAVLVFIAAIASASYAFYTTQTKTENEGVSSDNITEEVVTTLNDDNEINVTMIPGDTFEKTFSISISGADLKYHIAVFDLVNEFTRKEDITYVLTEDGKEIGKGQFPSPNGEDKTANLNEELITLPKGETKTYTLTITYTNDEKRDQSDDMGSSISGKIFIRGV